MPKVDINESLYDEMKQMAKDNGLSIKDLMNCMVYASIENTDYIDNLGIILMEVKKLE